MVAKTGTFRLCCCALLACLASSTYVSAQNLKSTGTIPKPGSFDTAVARLRDSLRTDSLPAEEVPGPAARVFDQLVHEVASGLSGKEISWELRVVPGIAGNAFSLPDGAVYVDNEMAQVLGKDPGLWAAVLAHEIVHITRHHWTKRSMFQDSLRNSLGNWGFAELGAFPIGPTSSTSLDQERQLNAFSWDLELEADVGSLDLMARTGFHPDFVTALYHLMEAHETDSSAAHFLASHPGWNIRESNLRKRYSTAVAEFEKLWPAPNDSPGGNPPVLAFVGRPRAGLDANHKSAEITLPLQCQNSKGSLEVVLLVHRLRAPDLPPAEQTGKLRQTKGCMSDRTMASFVLSAARPRDEVDVEFYVMDDRGWVLARSPKLRVRY